MTTRVSRAARSWHRLGSPAAVLRARLDQVVALLEAGLAAAASSPLFKLTLALSDIVFEAVSLELQVNGERCYLQEPSRGLARRWREAPLRRSSTPGTV